MYKLPELLAPAGNRECFLAAIEGGADAIYCGATSFNARMNAENFDENTMKENVALAHKFGVKVYQTVNTLVLEREMSDFFKTVENAINDGVDGFIIADLGAALAIHKAYPNIELHASTQMSLHGIEGGKLLKDYGFSRMVIARETPLCDIKKIASECGLETEVFVHGALCVCHSGQCLFSSVIGGRSGNRGECAQPCRLPYKVNGKDAYPLSLKDLCLASHIDELLESGVSSLKIEGRMKSPEYVFQVVSTWRKLLDERRNATKNEMEKLASVFSRNGFTDGYFHENISHNMLGIRSEEQKSLTKEMNTFAGLTKKIKLSAKAEILREKEAKLTLFDESGKSVTALGDIPFDAINRPMTKESVLASLSKLGNTIYTFENVEIALDDGLLLPMSSLNSLRRKAIELWENQEEKTIKSVAFVPNRTQKTVREKVLTARFYEESQITEKALKTFARIYLPLHKWTNKANGVILPAVIMEHEKEEVLKMLKNAKENGAKYALVGNLGHIAMAKECGFILTGDYRLNLYNSEAISFLENQGFVSFLSSPELTLPQTRDIKGNCGCIIYGRTPLMTLEKCVTKEVASCSVCEKNRAVLVDRKGVKFPILREWQHRNMIYNSLPTCMFDKKDLLTSSNLVNLHFLFSIESALEVDKIIDCYQNGTLPYTQVRRFPS